LQWYDILSPLSIKQKLLLKLRELTEVEIRTILSNQIKIEFTGLFLGRRLKKTSLLLCHIRALVPVASRNMH
jgi:hypothetical protein